MGESFPVKDQGPVPVFDPMPGKVVVKLIGETEFLSNKNGKVIFAAPSAQRPRTTGVVIAIPRPWSNNDEDLESFLKVGDKVIFGQHSGIEVGYGREKVLVLREIEILTRVSLPPDLPVEDVGVAAGANDDVE